MRVVFYLLVFIAALGSLFAILSGHGNDYLGVWNKLGPMNQGQFFKWALIIFVISVFAPVIDYFLRIIIRKRNERLEKKFMSHFSDGSARIHKNND